MSTPGNKHSIQNLLNWSWDETKRILGFGMVGWDGSAAQVIKVNSQGELIVDTGGGELAVNVQENSGDSNILYVGKATIGTATSAASWQIMRVNTTTGTVVDFADGDDSYDNIFDNRESLSYS